MEERQLKEQLASLKEIQPRKEWVFSTRQKLIGEHPASEQAYGAGLQKRGFSGIIEQVGQVFVGYVQRPAFLIPALTFAVAAGAVWHTAQSSLPGDVLYPIKTATEELPIRLSSNEERPLKQLELAKKRLADLRVVAQQNRVENLSPAIAAFEANVSEVSGSVTQIVENQPDKALQASRQIVQLQEEEQEIERILGTKIGEEQGEELTETTKRVVEHELADLETRALVEEQEELFEQAKQAAEQKRYGEALELIWKLSSDTE